MVIEWIWHMTLIDCGQTTIFTSKWPIMLIKYVFIYLCVCQCGPLMFIANGHSTIQPHGYWKFIDIFSWSKIYCPMLKTCRNCFPNVLEQISPPHKKKTLSKAHSFKYVFQREKRNCFRCGMLPFFMQKKKIIWEKGNCCTRNPGNNGKINCGIIIRNWKKKN